MTLNEVITLIALFVGPLLGVLLANFLANQKTKTERRHTMFRALLAGRMNSISLARVEALNLIPYEFINCSEVIAAWRAYLKSTNSQPTTQDDIKKMNQTLNEQYDELLFSIVKVLKIGIEQRDILNSGYLPGGLSDLVNLEIEARQGLSMLGKGQVQITTKLVSDN